ncbi:MAG: peptidoglycan DD-metalloendopeptidase family protein [Marinilabiliaceae bacterium]|jgi:murein DD-endopeptidase MepM/ murein hydrolase activator NlpD|nr:peptidoglycan DD-metalloendopeptidase family protein [Marinilabiliaceae bacterium]
MMIFQNLNMPIALLAAFLIISGCDTYIKPEVLPESRSDTLVAEMPPVLTFYGLDTTGYIVQSGRIRRNQFISEILGDYGIAYSDLNTVMNNSRETLDVRNIKAGKSYFLLLSGDSLMKADYLIYRDDPVTSYIFDFKDSLNISRFERETKLELRYSAGTIETSLWNSMKESGYNPVLAVELSELYAWTIDFFGLQKGDRYKIIYEEEFMDTLSMGIRKIHAAWFEHAGEQFYAIPMIQDSTESFFDLEGNSLRKAFLKAPLRFSRISSRYSNSRMHPVLRIRRPHHGVDYAAAVGTPVYAIGDGRVTRASYDQNNGRIVKIQHNSVYATAYLHLSRFGTGVAPGKYVKQGDIIGYVGSSGLSTGPHLDFRFYKNGYAVDPLKVEAPPVEPVSDENREKFDRISFTYKSLLDSF